MVSELESPSCSITLIRDPLQMERTRQAVPCSVGQWLSEVVPPECFVGEWIAIDGGRVVPRLDWDRHLLVPGAEILIYPRLGDVVTMVIIGVMVAATVAQTVMALTNKPQIPNVPTTSSDMNASPTYGFGGITNSTRIGAPVSVVYGKHRAGGQLIGLFVETVNDNDVIHMLLALSEGEVHGIDSLEINEQPFDNYTGVTYQTRAGTNSQTAIGLFGDKSATTINADAPLTTTFITYTTQGTNLNGFVVKLTFPGGLFRLDENGGFLNTSVSIEVDYKLTSSGTWTTGPRVTIQYNVRSVMRRQIRVDGLAAGRYDVRVRRTTIESTSTSLVDAVRREAVTELVNDGYTYPNTALLALQAVATNQLSGGIPRVTANVFGVKVKIFAYNNTYVVQWTQSPAWIVFDMLTNERYGYGRFAWRKLYSTGGLTVTNGSTAFSGTGTGWTAATLRRGDLLHDPVGQAIGIVDTINYGTQSGTLNQDWGGASRVNGAYEVRSNDIDIRSFIDWHVFCFEFVPNGSGGTEPRALCNIVFDAERENVWSAIQRVCNVGQASLIKIGSYIRIKIDKAEPPVQLFTMANIKAGTFEEVFLPLKERHNVFEVQFMNEQQDYRQDMIVLEDPLIFTNSEQIRRKTISSYGITRSSHAARVARFHQRISRYVTRSITFAVGLDAVACEPGDVIRFQHDVPQWGFGGRAAAGSTTSTIVLDREVMLAPDTNYEVLVRHADDTVETKFVTTGPSTVSTLSIFGTWVQTPAKGDIWAFGQLEISTKPFRVISIERTQELEARITAVEYNEAVYDESGLNATNQVNYSSLADLLGPPGPVKNLTILEQDNTELAVWISFTPPGSANFKTANIYRTDSGSPVLLGQSATGAFPISGLRGGEVITVKVTSVSSLGGESSYTSAPTASLVVSQVNPQDVPTLVLEGDRLRWNYTNPPRDLAGFLVRFRPGTSKSWESATPAHDNILSTTDLQIFRRSGIQTFLVKAVDKFGNESLTAKSLTVSFDDAETENIILTENHRTLGWPGTVSGGVLVGGDLKASASAVMWTTETAPMWSGDANQLMWTAAYGVMTYEFTIQPTADQLDAMLKLIITMQGEWSIDYQADSSALMWNATTTAPMWSGNAGLAMWDDPGGYTQWPGQVDHLRRQPYKIRITGHAGPAQAVLQQLSVVFDVPDLVFTLEDVPISAAGTRLSLGQPLRQIVSVRLAIQDDGGSAAYPKVLDKDPAAGPLVKLFNSSNVATTGLVDAVVHGY